MQAKLPDINTAFVKYRTHALACISSHNYNGAAACLNNINALFPEEYRVSINNSMYNQAVKDRVFYQCPNCKKEIPYSDVEILEVNNSFIVEILTGNKTAKIWLCSECKTENELRITNMISEKMKEPYYLKVVPVCPVRLPGLQNRLGFDQKFSNWFYNFLEELEYQLGQYRIEYNSQFDQDDTPDFKDGDLD